MTRQEFDRIVAEAVAVGADLKDAELHVIRGYHIAVDEAGTPVFDGETETPQTPPPVDPNAGQQTPPAV